MPLTSVNPGGQFSKHLWFILSKECKGLTYKFVKFLYISLKVVSEVTVISPSVDSRPIAVLIPPVSEKTLSLIK